MSKQTQEQVRVQQPERRSDDVHSQADAPVVPQRLEYLDPEIIGAKRALGYLAISLEQ